MARKGGRHRLECLPVGHALRTGLHSRTLRIGHLDVRILLHSLRQSRCSIGCAAAEPLGAALALGLMRRQRLTCGNIADPRHLLHMRCHTPTFPAFQTILVASVGEPSKIHASLCYVRRYTATGSGMDTFTSVQLLPKVDDKRVRRVSTESERLHDEKKSSCCFDTVQQPPNHVALEMTLIWYAFTRWLSAINGLEKRSFQLRSPSP